MNELNVNFEISKENIIRGSINGAALHIAIQHNRMKCFKLLLQHKDIDVNLPVHYECYTPLMMCAIYGRFEMMEILLLQKNIDVNFFGQNKLGGKFVGRRCSDQKKRKEFGRRFFRPEIFIGE